MSQVTKPGDRTVYYRVDDDAWETVVRRQIASLASFGDTPDQVAGLLDEYGWVEREQVGAAEYQVRYVRPVGREMPVSEIERFVSATKS